MTIINNVNHNIILRDSKKYNAYEHSLLVVLVLYRLDPFGTEL